MYKIKISQSLTLIIRQYALDSMVPPDYETRPKWNQACHHNPQIVGDTISSPELLRQAEEYVYR